VYHRETEGVIHHKKGWLSIFFSGYTAYIYFIPETSLKREGMVPSCRERVSLSQEGKKDPGIIAKQN